jgi:hypothetical protein
VDLFESDEPQGLTKPRREASTRWLRRWLLHKDDDPIEGDFSVFTDQELQCTKTSQVLCDEPGEKLVFDLNVDRAAELARRRASAPKDDIWLDEVRRLIALRSPAGPPRVEDQESRDMNGIVKAHIQTLHFETESGIVVPGVLFEPEKPAARSPLVVMLGAEGGRESGPGRPAPAAPEGRTAGARRRPPPTGQDIAHPRPGLGAPFDPDVKEAFLSLHLGRPLLGQRVGTCSPSSTRKAIGRATASTSSASDSPPRWPYTPRRLTRGSRR